MRALHQTRSVRRLTGLEETASTARVLNLLAIWRSNGNAAELKARPVFQNQVLNRSIILKHRIRPDEANLLVGPRFNATKVLVPIDPSDLRVGARYIFVGQRDFDEAANLLFGQSLAPGARDRLALDLLDALPSLDPFLVREQLRRRGFEPARAYFAVSESDAERMHDFVRQELRDLVELSGDGSQISTNRFVRKLLSTTPDHSFAPLKDILGLGDRDYEDGVFAWRGFLYYKWVMDDITAPVAEVAREIAAIRPAGVTSPEAAAYLRQSKPRIIAELGSVLKTVRGTLAVYDLAYADLVTRAGAATFRDFLLSAPAKFRALGLSLGAVQHITSYWRYRFPAGASAAASGPELIDLFRDFEHGLSTLRRADDWSQVGAALALADMDSGLEG